MITISRDEMYHLYHIKGLSLKKIGKQLGCSDKTVKTFMLENNIEIQKRNLDVFSNAQKKKIEKLYCEGLNPREIGDKMDLTSSKVKSYLIHNGIWIQMTSLEKKELKDLYQIQKLSIREIAKIKGCSTKEKVIKAVHRARNLYKGKGEWYPRYLATTVFCLVHKMIEMLPENQYRNLMSEKK